MDQYESKVLLTRIALYIAWTLAATLVVTAVLAGTGHIPIVFALGGDIVLGITAVICMLFAAQQPADPNEKSHH